MTIEVKQRDTHETTWTTNLVLTGASLVRLIAKHRTSKVVTFLTTVPDTANSVKHNLTGTLAPGEYEVELEATIGGVVITSPSDGFETLIVYGDLA